MTAAAVRREAENGVLVVSVRGETLSIAAAEVAEIMRVPGCTRVPNGPASLVGIANLRGAVLPIVSLAALLSDNAAGAGLGQTSSAARVVIITGAEPVGLLVDAIASLSQEQKGRLLDPRALLARDFGALLRKPSVRPGAGGVPRAVHTHPRDMLALIGLMVAGQAYALAMDKVAEVMRIPTELSAVPHTDNAMIGVAAFHGGLLPVVSLRILLGLPDGPPGPAARIVVAVIAGVRVGLVVDGVTGTLEVPAHMIDPVPPVLLRGRGEAQLDGICRLDGGRRLVCLLSPARLFKEDTAARIRIHGEQETARMSGSNASEGDAASNGGGEMRQFVVFHLGEEQYGVPIEAVDEVVRRPDALTRMPHAPDFVEGVMNLRGRAIPVIDASRRFGTTHGDGRNRRVVVLTVNGMQAGFSVDAVSEVLSVPSAELRPAPEFGGGGPALFDRVAIERGARMILLISAEGLLLQAERDLLAALSDAAGPGAAGPGALAPP